MTPVHVLQRTERWAVVAKPARLPCHASKLVGAGQPTLLPRLRERFGPVHLVHRLDRGASGCLLAAFDGPTTAMLQAALQAPDARKTYLAMVRGWFRWDDPVVIDTPMKDDRGRLREARSTVRCLGRSSSPRCSLLAVTPDTGRYHQVRRHVRDLDHPILGDSAHGDTRENRRWRPDGVERLALHLLAVDLPLPDGERLRAWCPPPEDLARVWRTLPWWSEAVRAEPRLAYAPLPLDEGPDPV